MISVIIPAKDAAATIAATIGSLAPDRALIGEILLLDDGSRDGTGSAAARAAEQAELPLKVIRGIYGGAGAARNAGLEAATGGHVFFLDADDEVSAGALGLLLQTLSDEPGAGLAVGSVLRRTARRPDKLKVPSGFGPDPRENARRYLHGELLPIAMGSALFAAEGVRDVRFPATVALDEDTCYWAALLTRLRVAATAAPVLLYRLDEDRMESRLVRAPRAELVRLSRALGRLAPTGIGRDALQWRKAWVALRIARMLVRHRRYGEARSILRMVRAHPAFRGGWKARQYRARIAAGKLIQSIGLGQPKRLLAAGPRLPLRTLVLTYDPASPPVSGADLRNYQNAQAASQLGPTFLVSILPSEPGADGEIATASLAEPGEPRGRALVRWRAPGEKRISLAVLARLQNLVRQWKPDVIVVEGIALSALLEPLRPLARLLILDMHNVESDLHGQTHVRTWRRWWDKGRIERQERRAVRQVDRVWVCSDIDREKLRRLVETQIPIDVVANGIPCGKTPAIIPPLPGAAEGWPVLVFVGHLGYPPNVEAASRLARRIFPAIRAKFPAARLILAGRYPKPAVRDLGALPGVELVENPADVSGLLARAHVSVVPLSAGGGTRIKIIEAAAAGIPVVATPAAAEGLDLVDGADLILADTDASLAAAVIELCSDPSRTEALRRRAWENALRLYGPAAVAGAVRRGMGLADS